MAYLVSLTTRAKRDLIALYENINPQQSAAALRWYQALKQSILSFEKHPNRCSVTPENKQLRHLLYGRKPHVYRVIFRIVDKKKQVDILHIRHGARQKFK